MKDDELYTYYITYLESRILEGKTTKAKASLLKISSNSFDEFKDKFINDELFNKKIIKMHTLEIRDKKIDDIFDDLD